MELRDLTQTYKVIAAGIPELWDLISLLDAPEPNQKALMLEAARCVMAFAVEPYRNKTIAMLSLSIYAMLEAYDALQTYPDDTKLEAVAHFTEACLETLTVAFQVETTKRPQLLKTLKLPSILANVEPMKLLE